MVAGKCANKLKDYEDCRETPTGCASNACVHINSYSMKCKPQAGFAEGEACYRNQPEACASGTCKENKCAAKPFVQVLTNIISPDQNGSAHCAQVGDKKDWGACPPHLPDESAGRTPSTANLTTGTSTASLTTGTVPHKAPALQNFWAAAAESFEACAPLFANPGFKTWIDGKLCATPTVSICDQWNYIDKNLGYSTAKLYNPKKECQDSLCPNMYGREKKTCQIMEISKCDTDQASTCHEENSDMCLNAYSSGAMKKCLRFGKDGRENQDCEHFTQTGSLEEEHLKKINEPFLERLSHVATTFKRINAMVKKKQYSNIAYYTKSTMKMDLKAMLKSVQKSFMAISIQKETKRAQYWEKSVGGWHCKRSKIGDHRGFICSMKHSSCGLQICKGIVGKVQHGKMRALAKPIVKQIVCPNFGGTNSSESTCSSKKYSASITAKVNAEEEEKMIDEFKHLRRRRYENAFAKNCRRRAPKCSDPEFQNKRDRWGNPSFDPSTDRCCSTQKDCLPDESCQGYGFKAKKCYTGDCTCEDTQGTCSRDVLTSQMNIINTQNSSASGNASDMGFQCNLLEVNEERQFLEQAMHF